MKTVLFGIEKLLHVDPNKAAYFTSVDSRTPKPKLKLIAIARRAAAAIFR